MIPNVTSVNELKQIRAQAEAVIAKVNEAKGTNLKFQIGSMIEFPRAACTADQIAQYADFFSFGTNDLTQTTFGFSVMTMASSLILTLTRRFSKRIHSRLLIQTDQVLLWKLQKLRDAQ